MSLTFKEKELVYVGASIAAGCKPCTNYHFKKVQEAGASDEEIKQAILDARCVRDNATKIMESHGLKKVGIQVDSEDCGCGENSTRIKELVSIAASFAVNCTSNLEKHISAAEAVAITEEEIKSVMDMALFVKGKAASHVEKISEKIGSHTESGEQAKDPCGCGEDNDSKKTIAEHEGKVAAESDCGCDGDC